MTSTLLPETIASVCDAAAKFDSTSLNAGALQKVRACIIDTFGVALAGANTRVARIAGVWAKENFREGQSGVWMRGERLAPAGAAFANAIAAHALDFDDTCYDGIVHASAIVLPAAVAVAEHTGASGKAALDAYAAGCQAAVEIGRVLTDDFYYRGWFNTGVLGRFGAAVAAVRLSGGDAAAMQRALSLCAIDSGGSRVVLGYDAKPYLAGMAAELGVRAAAMAAQPLSAPDDAWAHPMGFQAMLAREVPPQPHPRAGRFCFSEPGVALKLYPVCSAAQAAAEGLQTIMAEFGLRADDIRSIRAGGTALVVRSLRYREPRTPQEGQFSMNFALGCILRFGALGPAQLSPEALGDQRLAHEMAKVSMHLDEELENAPERALMAPESARLHIETTDGRVIERVFAAASGMPSRPFSAAQLQAKFMANAAFGALAPERADALYRSLMHLETLDHVSAIDLNP